MTQEQSITVGLIEGDQAAILLNRAPDYPFVQIHLLPAQVKDVSEPESGIDRKHDEILQIR